MKNSPPASITKRSPSKQKNGGLNGSKLITRLSGRNLYEMQLNTANYEAMMQRFQLRKGSGNKLSGRFSHAVIDTVLHKTGKDARTQQLSLQYFIVLLTQRKTWLQVWKTMLSPISPGSWVCYLHGLLKFSVNQFQLFYLPFSCVYYPNGSVGTIRTGITLQLVYLVDLLLHLNTAFVRQRELVTSRREIARNHISKCVVLEVVSVIPVDVVYGLMSGSPEHVSRTLLRYNAVMMTLRLLWLVLVDRNLLPKRIFQGKQHLSWFIYSRYAHLLGIARLIWLLILVAHYMACFWQVVTGRNYSIGIAEQYVVDFYYAVQLIQGQGNALGSLGENLYSTFVILTGSIVLAIVFGNIAMLVSNFNDNRTQYKQKMEGVFAKMDKMGLPLKLQERVHQYYTHVWTEYKSLDGNIVKFQRELAHTLGLEVGLYKYMNLVVNISFWESCSADFATQIILNLAVRVYLPDDYVVRKGETGDEMFMINRGICELLDPAKSQQPTVSILASTADSVQGSSELPPDEDDRVNDSSEDETKHDASKISERASSMNSHFKQGPIPIHRRSSGLGAQVHPRKSTYEIDPEDNDNNKSKKQILLYPGQAFGEMSLLMNYKRTANIRAATYVEICVFDRATFQRIISRYPEDRRLVLTMMIKKCIEKKDIPFPWDEIVDAVAERRRQSGKSEFSRLGVQTTVTSTEAAEALVDRIDVNRPDESIKYGFQTFHPDLKTSMAKTAVSTDYETRLGSNSNLRRKSIDKNMHPCSDRSDNPHASHTEAKEVIDSRIDGLEKMIATLTNTVNVMAASMARLEKNGHNRDACCKCCPNADQGGGSTVDNKGGVGDEARGPDYTTVPGQKKKLIRRRSSSNILSLYVKLQDSTPDKNESSGSPLDGSQRYEPAAHANFDADQSRMGSKGPIQVPASSLGSNELDMPPMAPRQAADSQLFRTSNDGGAYVVPKTMRGWASRSSSSNLKTTLADQLKSRRSGMRERKKLSDQGKSGTFGKITKIVSEPSLHVRSSFPSNYEMQAAAFAQLGEKDHHGPRIEPSKPKRRGSRVGIDAVVTTEITEDTLPTYS